MSEEKNTQLSENEGIKPKAKISRVGFIFGIVMLAVYFGMVYLLLFSPIFEATFKPLMRYIFAAIFAAYAVFRSYRFVKQL